MIIQLSSSEFEGTLVGFSNDVLKDKLPREISKFEGDQSALKSKLNFLSQSADHSDIVNDSGYQDALARKFITPIQEKLTELNNGNPASAAPLPMNEMQSIRSEFKDLFNDAISVGVSVETMSNHLLTRDDVVLVNASNATILAYALKAAADSQQKQGEENKYQSLINDFTEVANNKKLESKRSISVSYKPALFELFERITSGESSEYNQKNNDESDVRPNI